MNGRELGERVCAAINAGRLPHALLLAGEARSRRETGLRILQGLLCRAPQRPCLVCDDCRKAEAGVHPSVTLLAPELKKAITMAQVRALHSSLAQRAQNRVAVVEDMADLPPQAQNALLKLLEEPPEGVTLLLLGQEADALPTVRSRCFVLRVNETTAQAEPSDEVSQTALHAFLALCERGANPWDTEPFWSANKDAYKAVLAAWTQAAHDMLCLKIRGPQAQLSFPGARSALRARAQYFTTAQIHSMIESLWEAGKRLEGNANYALCGQWLLLRLLEER